MAQEQNDGITTTQYCSQSISRPAEDYDPCNDSKESEKRQLITSIESIVGRKGTGKEPLNIVVLGCPGSGKSALLNTVFTSLRVDHWTERARVGCFGTDGQQVTKHVMSFTSEFDYYQEEPEILLPTFIDVQGLENDDDDFNKEFLQALLNGKIRNNQSMAELHSIFDNDGPEKLRALLNRQENNLKVDRIIVVASSEPTTNLPNQFLQCIHDSMKCKRDIPLFGVLTRADKFQRNEDRITKFKNTLGITEDKFLFMTNYCPDIDRQLRYHNNVFPYIDVPVLRFLKQVVNPHLRVITPNITLKEPNWIELIKPSISSQGPYILLQIFLIIIFLFWLLFPPVNPHDLNIICAENDSFAKQYIREFNVICSDKKKITTFPVGKAFIFMIFIALVLPLINQHGQPIRQIIPQPETDRSDLQEGNFGVFIVYSAVCIILVLALIYF